MADEKNGVAAVYVAWTTFKNALESLADSPPNVVDRSAFAGQSWGVQSQLLAGLKFLGLITDEGKPTAVFDALAVPDEAVRKKKLEAIIRERYADLFALDLTKATPQQLAEQMGESYNVSGDTRGKAVRFFLSAVDYLGIPVSKFLKREGAASTAPTPRRRRASSSRATTTAEDQANDDSPGSEVSDGPSRTVKLKSGGGTLTVSLSLDPFALSDEDQKFVFELINRLRDYEKE